MFFRNVLPALLWALFIAILCGIPGRDIPHSSFLELLAFDKWVHATVFFILVYLLLRAFRKEGSPEFLKRHAVFIALLVSIFYGGILEILQEAVFSERSADLYDFIANSFGAVAAPLYVRWKKKPL
jgi:VanZ family protein